MRITRIIKRTDLAQVLSELIASGAVIEVLTSDLEYFVMSGRRRPTIIYRPDSESPHHVWCQCPDIDAESFDETMDLYNDHWEQRKKDPQWQAWLVSHPLPADVANA